MRSLVRRSEQENRRCLLNVRQLILEGFVEGAVGGTDARHLTGGAELRVYTYVASALAIGRVVRRLHHRLPIDVCEVEIMVGGRPSGNLGEEYIPSRSEISNGRWNLLVPGFLIGGVSESGEPPSHF